LRLHGTDLACVMIEPIAGNMNFVRATRALHASAAASCCTEHGALLVFDEVMTGFRVALGSAQSVYARAMPGFAPDITVLGKVIGGGMPLAAFGGKRAVMEQLAPAGPGLPGRHLVRQPGGHRLRTGHAATKSASPAFTTTLAQQDARAWCTACRALPTSAGVPFCGGQRGRHVRLLPVAANCRRTTPR